MSQTLSHLEAAEQSLHSTAALLGERGQDCSQFPKLETARAPLPPQLMCCFSMFPESESTFYWKPVAIIKTLSWRAEGGVALWSRSCCLNKPTFTNHCVISPHTPTSGGKVGTGGAAASCHTCPGVDKVMWTLVIVNLQSSITHLLLQPM